MDGGILARALQNVENSAVDRVGIATLCTSASPTYTIQNNVIYGTNNVNDDSDYGFYEQPGGSENVVFSHNVISKTGANSILVEQHSGPSEISYNTLDVGCYGSDAIFCMAYNGLYVTALQNVSYNTFDMGTGGPFDYDHRATGVSFNAPVNAWGEVLGNGGFSNMLISGNTFINLESNRRAIGFWNNNNTADNLVAPQIANNTVNGVSGSLNSSGIDLYGFTGNARIIGNTIQGTDTAVYLRNGDAPGTQIDYNNIAGNTVGLDWTDGSLTDARFNWWGNPSGPGPAGLGDNVTGNANVTLWLQSPFAARLYTDPGFIAKSYADIGTDFALDVKVEKIEDFFGFDINITWDNTLITFEDCDYSALGALWSSYAVTENTSGVNAGVGWFKLVVVSTSSNFTTTSNQPLFTLKFHIEKGSNLVQLQTPIHFGTAKLSNSLTPIPIPIPAAVKDGFYQISSITPIMELTLVDPNPSKPFEYGKTLGVQVNATHVADMTGYDLTILFNPELLEFVGVGDLGVLGTGQFSNGTGSVHVWTAGASQAGDNITLFELTIHVEFDDRPEHIWRAGHPQQLTAQISVENDTGDLSYATGTIPITSMTLPSPLILTINLIRGDVNCDGKVDVLDLRAIAANYDQSTPAKYDLTNDGTIDIFDLVVVATNFGYVIS